MSDTMIRVDHLSKYYRLGEVTTARKVLPILGARGRRLQKEGRGLWALDDISFEVKQGEVMGVIGRNGAGKSTLLKILSRLTDPTRGSAVINGRVGSLLEVGTGFHPELTGRENVFLNGSILGMSRKEIEQKFDEIVDFSEIGDFLDTPVKRYSSGMFTRLAFAVASNLDPEILIVDEVLSVGDAAFQKKCLAKINHLMKSGRTVLFVSHNIGSVNELCTSAILLDKGKMMQSGNVSDVIESYVKLITIRSTVQDREGWHGDRVSLNRIWTTKTDNVPETTFDLNEDISIQLEYEVHEPLETLQAALLFRRNMLDLFSTFDTDGFDQALVRREPGKYRATLRLPGRFLKAGGYSVTAYLGTISDLLLEVPDAAQFTIEEITENTAYRGYKRERLGHVVCPGEWSTVGLDAADFSRSTAKQVIPG